MIASAQANIGASKNDNQLSKDINTTGELVTQYYMSHPEVFESLLVNLANKKKQGEYEAMLNNVIAHKNELLDKTVTPYFGDENGDVSVILFFDYQCVYCSKLHASFAELTKSTKNVKFLYKEWPIFSERWKESNVAALTGLAIWKKEGSDAYIAYHNSIFETNHNEGKLTLDDIKQASQNVAVQSEVQNPEYTDIIRKNFTLARDIGLSGTPVVIIMPSKNATIHNTTVFLGMTDKAALNAAIDKAR